MKAIENKKIAIVGGGPGGLTLARLLQMKGADIKVYERDLNKDVRVQGATLDLHEESGLAALTQAGLMDAFGASYRPGADKLRITDKDANVVFDDSLQTAYDSTTRPEIDRGPLRKILLESLDADTVVWDSQFVSMIPQGAGWQLQFRNGTSAYADIVIAADGANSRIRPLLTPLKPFYAGITVVEGAVYDSATAVPALHELLNGGKIFALGNAQSLIVSSKGDGSMVFYLGFNAGESWSKTCGIDFTSKAQVIAWFKTEFAGWGSAWLQLFEQAEPAFMLRPQYCMPLNQTWDTQPNLTMLGDAAHLMPPYAGEGVNMAMLDALQLSNCLTGYEYTDTKTAIAAYEQQMLARFAEVGQMTLDQTAAIHSAGGLQGMLDMFKGEG